MNINFTSTTKSRCEISTLKFESLISFLENLIISEKSVFLIADSNLAKFKEYKELFEEIYLNTIWTSLSELNQHIIKKISIDIFSITTKFNDSRNFNLSGEKEKRYIPLLKQLGVTEYISGPSAKHYLTEEMLEKEGIKLTWLDYSNYREYNQLFPPFKHDVSVLDLIFNEGPNAKEYMISFK